MVQETAAEIKERAAEAGKTEQLVVFKVSGEEYGVDIANVQEILREEKITKLPQAPDFIEGVINVRGDIVTVIDLAKRFGLSTKERGVEVRIVIVEVEGNRVGMIVDAVSEVLRLSSDQIKPAPSLVAAGIESAYLRGIGDLAEANRLIILLDLDKILSKEEIVHIAQVYASKKVEKEALKETVEKELEAKKELETKIEEEIRKEAKEKEEREKPTKEKPAEEKPKPAPEAKAKEEPIIIEEEELKKPKKPEKE